MNDNINNLSCDDRTIMYGVKRASDNRDERRTQGRNSQGSSSNRPRSNVRNENGRPVRQSGSSRSSSPRSSSPQPQRRRLEPWEEDDWGPQSQGRGQGAAQQPPQRRNPQQPQPSGGRMMPQNDGFYDDAQYDDYGNGGQKNRPQRNAPNQQRTRDNGGNGRRTKKKKRKRIIPKIITTLVILAVFVFGIYSAVVLSVIKKINVVDTEQRIATTASSLMYSKDVRNILLIGTDARTTDERGRSDSMILLSICKKTKKMYMTSLMRDMYVSIPGYGETKINAAYSYGGPELLMDTIQDNIQIKIDDYVMVNFISFADVVDAVGGVEITLTDEEAQAVNQILYDEVNGIMGDDQNSDFLEGGGKYVLNGKQALSYSRVRYVGNADFQRTERQRTVLNEIIKQAKSTNPLKLVSAMKSVFPEVTTNLSKNDMYMLSLRAPFLLAGYEMEQMRVPAEDLYYGDTIDGASVLVPDFEANINMLKEALYGE